MKEEIIKKMERAFEIISFEVGEVLPDHLAKDFNGKKRFESKVEAAIDRAVKEVLTDLDPVAEKFLNDMGCNDAVHIKGRW